MTNYAMLLKFTPICTKLQVTDTNTDMYNLYNTITQYSAL